MANPIRINAATLNRPGVFVTQSSTGGLPQPLATHAVGYVFGTTPTDDYYSGEEALEAYSRLEPYKPIQIGSTTDFIEKIGGQIPTGNKGVLASYDAVRAFFDNAGVNGILYFTRVSPTPETVIDLGASNAGSGYNAFALKINGRYYGTPIGVNDPEGAEISVITTTGLDQVDNARDLYTFLSGNGNEFSDYYIVEQNAVEATAGKFRIFSRDTKSMPVVDRFFAFANGDYSNRNDLDDDQLVVKFYTSVKEMNFRCKSSDIATGEEIFPISGAALSSFLTSQSTTYTATASNFDDTANTITLSDAGTLVNANQVVLEGTDIGTLAGLDFNTIYYVTGIAGNSIQLSLTSGGSVIDFTGVPGADVTVRKISYNPTEDQSDIIKAFIIDQGIYDTSSDIPDDKIVAVTKDVTSTNLNHIKWDDASASYWRYDLATFTFSEIQSGGVDVTPTGTVNIVGGVQTRSGYLPDTVQVFYVNIAGEDRAIIVNGADPKELTENLVSEINSVLQEKEIDGFYTVEAIVTPELSESTPDNKVYAPNNGHKNSKLVSEHGAPYLRPELDDISLPGTIDIATGAVTGTVTGVNTTFLKDLAPGDTIVSNGVRFTIQTIVSDTSATVLPRDISITANSSYSLDKSIPNGFYSFEYVLRLKITSNNGIPSPINPGNDRFENAESDVVKLVSMDQHPGYESYKLSALAKAKDFVFSIEQGMGSGAFPPGFLLAPEAYTVLSYEVGVGDFSSKLEARQERLKITQSLVKAAEGKLGPTEGLTGTQHVALIDCGSDERSLSEVQDELDLIKRTVGVPFGHAAYYAPYIKNLDDRYVAPSGFVAGIACSRYVNEGFQAPPAGARYPLRGAIGLKFDISAQQQEVTYALGLNPIRSLPNRGIVTWGTRTLSSNPLFKFVNTRVILNVLVDVMSRSFDDILFETIDSAGTIYARVKSIATQILGQFFRQGALYGARAEQAYLVVCSSANNNDVDLENGTVRLDVYVATSPTLERLLITIVRTPSGQVSQLSDSFSRNEERFSYLLNSTTVF